MKYQMQLESNTIIFDYISAHLDPHIDFAMYSGENTFNFVLYVEIGILI